MCERRRNLSCEKIGDEIRWRGVVSIRKRHEFYCQGDNEWEALPPTQCHDSWVLRERCRRVRSTYRFFLCSQFYLFLSLLVFFRLYGPKGICTLSMLNTSMKNPVNILYLTLILLYLYVGLNYISPYFSFFDYWYYTYHISINLWMLPCTMIANIYGIPIAYDNYLFSILEL